MSKKLEEKIIKDIKSGSIKMRPKWIFVLGSIFTAIGVLLATSLGLLSIQLIRFRLNHPGSAGTVKIMTVIASLPWYIPVLTIFSLIGGYYFLKQYDFSYRKNASFIMILVLLGLVFGSYILDKAGADQILMKRGYFRRIYNQDSISSPLPRMTPRDGRGRNRLNQSF